MTITIEAQQLTTEGRPVENQEQPVCYLCGRAAVATGMMGWGVGPTPMSAIHRATEDRISTPVHACPEHAHHLYDMGAWPIRIGHRFHAVVVKDIR